MADLKHIWLNFTFQCKFEYVSACGYLSRILSLESSQRDQSLHLRHGAMFQGEYISRWPPVTYL